jgi:hypothetical protein
MDETYNDTTTEPRVVAPTSSHVKSKRGSRHGFLAICMKFSLLRRIG